MIDDVSGDIAGSLGANAADGAFQSELVSKLPSLTNHSNTIKYFFPDIGMIESSFPVTLKNFDANNLSQYIQKTCRREPCF